MHHSLLLILGLLFAVFLLVMAINMEKIAFTVDMDLNAGQPLQRLINYIDTTLDVGNYGDPIAYKATYLKNHQIFIIHINHFFVSDLTYFLIRRQTERAQTEFLL